MKTNTEYSITDQESGETLLRTHEFKAVWDKLELLGADRGRMSVVAVVDDPDEPEDGNTTALNSEVVWEDGEEAFS